MQSRSTVHRQQHQQQQRPVREHAGLRRTDSPLYNYTALWVNDLFPRGPNSSSSTSPVNPIDRMVKARQRWTRSVCAGFVVCLLANVASTVFVCVTLNSDRQITDHALIRQFMSHVRTLHNCNIYLA